VRLVCVESRQVGPRLGSGHQAVAEETLGIDRIVTELFAQLLAQLADVALDDVLLDLFVEDAVDRVEDLGLGDAAAALVRQIFEDAALAAGQGMTLPSISGSRPSV
jgi:hypothetical protein